MLARMGGDEFTVILPETDEDAAFRVLERVRESIADHNRQFVNDPLSVALGVATAAPREPLEQALRLADARMYEDKAATADRPHQPPTAVPCFPIADRTPSYASEPARLPTGDGPTAAAASSPLGCSALVSPFSQTVISVGRFGPTL